MTNTMESEVKVNIHDRIIEVKSIGVVTYIILKNQMDEIKKLGLENNIYKVLVDSTEQIELPPLDIIEKFMSNLSGYFIYAIYAFPGQKTKDDLIKGIARSLKSGLLVRHFSYRDEALTWLKSKKVCGS